jgi:CheY-like chemotaxis protein
VDLPQRMAFVVQPNRLQGLIWQALLKSQRISVILENANGELGECLEQIAAAGLTLPEFIILDAETPGLNPYEFCRWCRERFPKIKVFLTRIHIQPLTEGECRWAMNQGARGFFNGFTRETLMSTAVVNIKQILTVAGEPFLDERALLMVLLNIRRQIGTAKSAVAAAQPETSQVRVAQAAPAVSQLTGNNGRGPGSAGTGNGLDWVASGLQALNHSRLNTEAKPDEATTPSTLEPAANWPERPVPKGATEFVRKYRGVAY